MLAAGKRVPERPEQRLALASRRRLDRRNPRVPVVLAPRAAGQRLGGAGREFGVVDRRRKRPAPDLTHPPYYLINVCVQARDIYVQALESRS